MSDAPTYRDPAYRRTMWIVILLNLGYGAIEVIAGFVGDSQSLKADALDFLGDGAISLLGLLAIGWQPVWRARAALLQGSFLGILGASVLVLTMVRLVRGNDPEATVMSVIGAGGFLVNVLAAALLVSCRTGDANMRAVWLFSRNDAIGNLAVVIAAGAVALTGERWPDLAVAVAIAALFLQSSRSIVRVALGELRAIAPERTSAAS
jgi:Co/Zn/Cd efflux system component